MRKVRIELQLNHAKAKAVFLMTLCKRLTCVVCLFIKVKEEEKS